MSNTLIEDQLHRNAGIRAGKYRGEWFLLVDRVLFQDGKVVLVGSETAGYEPLIASGQLPQCGVGTGWVLG
jgi:hypothetical protein